MKALYPADHKITLLSQPALALKISRHSRCSVCSCLGLRPAPGVQLILDSAQAQNQVDEPLRYLALCSCGHGVPAHGAELGSLGKQEYARRGRVAVRLDEILQVRFLLI
jgi:histone acetyltransferase